MQQKGALLLGLPALFRGVAVAAPFGDAVFGDRVLHDLAFAVVEQLFVDGDGLEVFGQLVGVLVPGDGFVLELLRLPVGAVVPEDLVEFDGAVDGSVWEDFDVAELEVFDLVVGDGLAVVSIALYFTKKL